MGEIRLDEPSKEVLEELNSTSYSIGEIIKIEKAFENEKGDPDGYKGLYAVFDVLIDIHQGSDKQLKLAKDKLLQL